MNTLKLCYEKVSFDFFHSFKNRRPSEKLQNSSLFRCLVDFDHFKAPQPPQIDQRQAQVDHRQPQPQLQRQPPRQPQRRPGRPTGQNRPRPQQARGRPSVGQKRPEIYRPKKQYAGTINTLKKVRLTFLEHSSRC